MCDRRLELFAIDIIIACDKIKRYTKDFENGNDLLYDELVWDATIRELEIIGEATKYLLKNELINKNYRVVVDFRNMITHGYFGIDNVKVFEVIKINLYDFENDILKSLEIFDKDKLIEAIDCSIEDFKYNKNVVSLLNKLLESYK